MDSKAETKGNLEDAHLSREQWRARIAELLEEGHFRDWNGEVIKEWLGWDNEPASLLMYAVVAQADVATTQKIHESDPSALTRDKELIGMACLFGASPGVIPFLVQQEPGIVHYRFLYCNILPMQALLYPRYNAGRMAEEEDVKALVDPWPECIAMSICSYTHKTPLQLAVEHGYSKDLIEYMLDKLPSQVESFAVRFDHGFPLRPSDLDWVSRVVSRVQGPLVCRATWNTDTFKDLLGVFFLQGKHATSLELKLGYDGDTTISSYEMTSLARQLSLRSTSSLLQTLILDFRGKDTKSFGAFCCGLLDCLVHLSSLQEVGGHGLCIMPEQEPSTTAFCALLAKNRLKTLSVNFDFLKPNGESLKRKRDSSLLHNVFETLKTSSALEALWIKGTNKDVIRGLVDVMKHNYTLVHLELWPIHPSIGDEAKPLKYLLELNSCGRKQAQDSNTSLVDFVALLGAVPGSHEPMILGNQAVTSLQYGLLREAVGKWANCSSGGF